MNHANAKQTSIDLSPAEIQSGLDRVKWAEGLIEQLPESHEGRNSWLLNYGVGGRATALRVWRMRDDADNGYVPTPLHWVEATRSFCADQSGSQPPNTVGQAKCENKDFPALPADKGAEEPSDTDIGRYLMALAKQNSPTSWPHLWRIEFAAHATTNEGDGYKSWSLREAIADHMKADGWIDKEKQHG